LIVQHLVFTTLFVLVTQLAYGQSTSVQIGGRAASIAYASACLQDEWSLFNNVAGQASLKHIIAASTYDAKPKLEGANRSAFVFAIPTNIGVVGAGALRFGDALYNEQLLSISFSNQLGLASLGATLNYLQYTAQGFGTKSVMTVSAGGIAALSNTVSIGAYVLNINQPLLSEIEGEKVPTRLSLGLGITPGDKVQLSSELSKEIDHEATFKTGMEYKATKKFHARTGFSLYPNNIFFGIGFIQSKLSIDYAYQYALTGLGDSHQASLAYKWKKK
jgi:hypothetical protein